MENKCSDRSMEVDIAYVYINYDTDGRTDMRVHRKDELIEYKCEQV